MTARGRAESTPVARDEVGEVGPMLRTADDLRQYEREGVRLDGSMGFAWWVDGDWITATDQYFSSKALIEDYGFVFVSFDPHLTPQPDGDVRGRVARRLYAHEQQHEYPDLEVFWEDLGRDDRDYWLSAADAVLASGLVVPVGEVAEGVPLDADGRPDGGARGDLLNTDPRVALRAATARADRAVAQVAAVRRELERWDGYGHGEFNIHMPENLPCSACNLMAAIRAEIRAALDTAPASPTTDQRDDRRCPTPGCEGDGRYAAPGRGHAPGCTSPVDTDQRIEARQLSGEHVGREVVLPDGDRLRIASLDQARRRTWLFRADGRKFTIASSTVLTLIGGEDRG